MTHTRPFDLRTSLLIITPLVLASACFHREQAAPELPPPAATIREVAPQSSAPSEQMMGARSGLATDASEPYIELLTASNEDVRLVLQKIAEIGKLDLVIPGNIHKTISVKYVHVPVSVALKDVLKRSGLQLHSGQTPPLPFDTVTVFYRLPANVDSLSVEGIMKRFGVGREIAELIVKSRPPER